MSLTYSYFQDQDPGYFGEPLASIAKEALTIRYYLLPFLYLLFYRHSVAGDTVARPLWHEFPTDLTTWDIDDQFLWGEALLISPVVQEGERSRRVYLPPSSRWFSVGRLFTGGNWSEAAAGEQEVDAPLDLIPLHLRGGHILPLQRPAVNTKLSRTNPLELLAGLDDDISARGSIFLDDGETVDTVANGQYFLGDLQIRDNTLTMTVVHNDDVAVAGLHFERIVVLGFREPIRSIIVNGDDYTDWTFSDGALFINNLSLQVNDNFEILFL